MYCSHITGWLDNSPKCHQTTLLSECPNNCSLNRPEFLFGLLLEKLVEVDVISMNSTPCFRGDNTIEKAVSQLQDRGAARYLFKQSSPTWVCVGGQSNLKWGSTTMCGEVPAVEAITHEQKRNDFGCKDQNLVVVEFNMAQ